MKKLLYTFIFLFFSMVGLQAQINLTVAQDGTGNHTTVQAAINAAPTGQTTPYRILIKKGKYREKISIPSNKPFIYLIGEDVNDVILSWDDFSGKPIPGGGGATFGTANSATVTFNAPDCGAVNITFENTTGDAPQALAINVNSTRCVFKNCKFTGGQDTVLTNGAGNLQYFRNCYIDGVVDFIFGGAIAVFDSTIVYARTRLDNLSGSFITAANTPSGQTYGYVFRDCVIPANRGTTTYFMGRPWQNDGTSATPSHTKTVFINTTMSSSIKPEGWSVWSPGTITSIIYYGEYRSRKFDSSLVDVSQRVSWSYQLNATEASTYTNSAIFGSWNPCATLTEVCNYYVPSLTVANFRGVKGTSNSNLTWNICWPNAGVKHEIFRSTNRINFTKISELTSANDTTVNYNFSEAVPPPGSSYFYYIWTSKAGHTAVSSDTIEISSIPTITTTGTPGSFVQGLGTPSATQSYTVSGVNLTNPVTITPPASFEISNNGGNTWVNNSSSISLTQDANGNLAATTIQIRLNGTTAGTVSGNIVHTSTGAVNRNVALSGTIQSAPLVTLDTLQYWPFTTNNIATVVRTGVNPSTPTLQRLTLSNGTTVTNVPAYSVLHGMAYGASSNGDGTWTTAVGGPGGNLNRAVYVQFTITANSGFTVEVDSLILNHTFFNTSSNTRLAVVYSKSNFTADSADVSGGITGADGLALPATAFGSFANPITISNSTANNLVNYRLALNGSTGVTLAAGETLTVRLYNSCGSGSSGRYAKIKDLLFKGLVTAALPVRITQLSALANGNKNIVKWNVSNEVNVHYYQVEKSATGADFKTVTTVNAGRTSYEATDLNPYSNVTYYRLKIVDKDGSFSYSNILLVQSKTAAAIKIFPQPVVTNAVTIQHLSTNKDASLIITDIQGKIIKTIKPVIGSNFTMADVSNLSKGTYIVSLEGMGERVSTLLLKQ